MSENTDYRILVVDDNEWNRDILGRRLSRQGYAVELAEDGYQALQMVEQQPLDLILLDIMMPGLSGIEVLRKIRETRDGKSLPIVMATAKDGSDDMVEALDLGANDYVTKPLDFKVVLARVKAQLRGKAPATLEEDTSQASEQNEVRQGSEIEPGMVLTGKYRIEARIGAGNFGAVYRATHMAIQRSVAIKILQSSFETESGTLERFRREAVSACRIQHPNAVEVLDFGVTPAGVAFLVMELLEGRTLSEVLRAEGRLSPERCLGVLGPVCDALAEAHAVGIVHRDIKPANIFLHESRHGEVVKVLDFGIAKLVGDAAVEQHLTLDGGLLGTPAYMAPERVRGQAYDGRSDVYSLGTMLYLMLAGRLPFGDRNLDPITMAVKQMRETPPRIREFAPELPATIEAIVMLCLEKDAEKRPQASELASELAMAMGRPPTWRAALQGPVGTSQVQGVGVADRATREEAMDSSGLPLAEAPTIAGLRSSLGDAAEAPTVEEDSAAFFRPPRGKERPPESD